MWAARPSLVVWVCLPRSLALSMRRLRSTSSAAAKTERSDLSDTRWVATGYPSPGWADARVVCPSMAGAMIMAKRPGNVDTPAAYTRPRRNAVDGGGTGSQYATVFSVGRVALQTSWVL